MRSIGAGPPTAAQLCGVEDFIMWTMVEERSAHTLVQKYMETAVNGAEVMANRYGMAMIATGSVLGNNDIFSDQAVNDYSIKYLHDFVKSAMNKGAGPQVFYHLCGNHETDYKLFKDRLVWSPFTIMHVGYKVAAEMGDRYLGALARHEDIIARNVTENIFERHLKPVFVDVDRHLCLDPASVAKRITKRTRAVMFVGRAAKAAWAHVKGSCRAGTLPSRNSSARIKSVSAQTATIG